MGKLIIIFYSIFLAITLNGCIKRGYTNKYGKYVPKNPKFKLKDKPFLFPPKLDTVNIYKLVYKDFMGKPEFSLKDNIWPDDLEETREITYIKFYPKGRYIEFNVRTKFENIIKEGLTEKDMDPHYATQGYYIYDAEKITVELFIYGEGYGSYSMFNCFLDNAGNTIIRRSKTTKTIYEKEKLPENWKKYPIDW